MRGSFMNCMGDRGPVTIAIARAGGNVAGHKSWESFALFSGFPSSPLCMKIKHEGLPSNPLCMKNETLLGDVMHDRTCKWAC